MNRASEASELLNNKTQKMTRRGYTKSLPLELTNPNSLTKTANMCWKPGVKNSVLGSFPHLCFFCFRYSTCKALIFRLRNLWIRALIPSDSWTSVPLPLQFRTKPVLSCFTMTTEKVLVLMFRVSYCMNRNLLFL